MGNEEADKTASRRNTWWFFSSGTFLFVVAVWIAMADVHYVRGSTVFPFSTAMWFVIGSVFILPVAAAYSAAFWFIGKWVGRVPAWILQICASLALIALAVHSALPARQMRVVVGEEAASLISVESLIIRGSFNDGRTYFGVIAGPDSLMASILKDRHLKREESASLHVLQQVLRGARIPDYGPVNSDEWGYFYTDPDTHKVYFCFWDRVAREDGN